MYKIIAIISTIVRQLCISNPFEALGDGLIITIGGAPLLLTPDVLNWIAEPFVHGITFFVVGLYYDKGGVPTLGSFLYLLFYCIHIFLLWIMSVVKFNTWIVITIFLIYVGGHIGLKPLKNYTY